MLLFREDLDQAALDSRRTVWTRVIMAVIFAGVAAVDWNMLWAVVWLIVALIMEACSFFAYPAEGRGVSEWHRWRWLAALFGGCLTWTVLALLFWTSSDRVLQVVSAILLIGYTNAAVNFAFYSRLVSITAGLPPVVGIIALPFLGGSLQTQAFVTLGLVVLLALAQFVVSSRENAARATALRQAQSEVETERTRAVAANQAKTTFLAMMSHELRTPMNGVLGMAHALNQPGLTERQAQQLDMLIRSGDNLMTILNDLLDISKIEAGRLELEVLPFDVHELVYRVRDLWEETAKAKGLGLLVDIHPDTPRHLVGDPTRIRQILTNLVSNALKFTTDGQIGIRVRRSGDDATRAELEIAVADTGLGISAEQQAKLFQPFAQAEASTSRHFGGTGLGLAICRQLANLMGGDISLTSAAGEGSTFTMHVVVAIDTAGPTSADDSSVVRQSDLSGLTVLVADDNEINLAVATMILEALGVSIVSASNGAEALERLAHTACDLVLMDVHMPVMGGAEALRRIRAGEAGRPDVPIVALTADAAVESLPKFLALGFDAVEAKPIVPASLVSTIAAFAGRAAQVPALAHTQPAA